jgi:hypothetical protein
MMNTSSYDNSQGSINKIFSFHVVDPRFKQILGRQSSKVFDLSTF